MTTSNKNDDLRIEIELNAGSGLGSARVVVRPTNHYVKTLACVIDTLKQFFTNAGYSVDRLMLQSDASSIEVIIFFRLGGGLPQSHGTASFARMEIGGEEM